MTTATAVPPNVTGYAVLLGALAFVASAVMTGAATFLTPEAARDYGTGAQKIGTPGVPRTGGVAVVVACALAVAAVHLVKAFTPYEVFDVAVTLAVTIAASLPAVAGGFLSDVDETFGAVPRLLTSAASAAVFVAVTNAAVHSVGVPQVDAVLGAYPAAAKAFTVFAVTGVVHAFNLVDGVNGLMGFTALTANAALAFLAYRAGAQYPFVLSCLVAAAVLGFLVWNFPGGHVYAGDSGSYFVGFATAVSAVLLYCHGRISGAGSTVPEWVILLTLVFPVWETVFSMARRIVTVRNPTSPDAFHLHSLVFRTVRFFTTSEVLPHVAACVVCLLPYGAAVYAATRCTTNDQARWTAAGYVMAYLVLYYVFHRTCTSLELHHDHHKTQQKENAS